MRKLEFLKLNKVNNVKITHNEPINKLPVSPMKIRALGLFKNKNPAIDAIAIIEKI